MTAAPIRRFATGDDLAAAAADRIIAGLRTAAAAGRPYVLGCPGGRTPRPIYQTIGQRAARIDLDCSGLVIVMMDDYLDPAAAGPALVAADAHYSCRRFAEHEIRGTINAGLDPAKRIPANRVLVPNPVDPAGYDRRLADMGGVDLFLVASGATDGHVAFCGPGAPIDGETSVVTLAPGTREDNMITFPDFEDLAEVPTRGVSVGLGTIRRLSRSVLLILAGADKRESARLVGQGRYEPSWPATFIHECPDPAIWVDAAAGPPEGVG